MADHITTIRLKTVGMAEASTEVQALDRNYSASPKGMEAANKAFAASKALGDVVKNAKDATWQIAEMEKQLRILERAGIVDKGKQLNFVEKDINRHYDTLSDKYEGHADLMVAAERSRSVELADVQSRRYDLEHGAAEKSAEAGMKLNLKVKAAEYKAAVKANEDLLRAQQQAASQFEKELEKELSDRAKLVEKSQMDGAKLQLQVNKRTAQEARREARTQEQLDKANGGGLSGFGGKMILGMLAGRAAGDVLGDR